MTKSQLVKVVAKKANLTKNAAQDAVDTIFEEISRRLEKGEKVLVSGFATFDTTEVDAKDVVPFGDESKRQTVPAHRVVTFKPGKPLRDRVW
jgi:DNA-binding protein HU-beta